MGTVSPSATKAPSSTVSMSPTLSKSSTENSPINSLPIPSSLIHTIKTHRCTTISNSKSSQIKISLPIEKYSLRNLLFLPKLFSYRIKYKNDKREFTFKLSSSTKNLSFKKKWAKLSVTNFGKKNNNKNSKMYLTASSLTFLLFQEQNYKKPYNWNWKDKRI